VVPRISEFYGIAIYMYFNDHNPPHFHAIYGGNEAQVEIASGDLIGGALPRTAEKLVLKWLEIHRSELENNWRRAAKPEPLESIAPLR